MATRSTAANLFVSLRPDQWTKNLIVFAALIFAVKLLDPAALANASAAFLIFCAWSGAVYLINEGNVQKFSTVKFEGNSHSIAPDGRVKTLIQSKPPMFWLFKGQVDPKKIDAKTNDGVLEVTIPLPKEAGHEPVTIKAKAAA